MRFNDVLLCVFIGFVLAQAMLFVGIPDAAITTSGVIVCAGCVAVKWLPHPEPGASPKQE